VQPGELARLSGDRIGQLLADLLDVIEIERLGVVLVRADLTQLSCHFDIRL
jgi:hypothetical protein